MSKSPIRRGYAEVSFGQVHYRTGGTGDTPLVMFHGSASSTRMLLPLITELVRSRRVIAFDTPGNGESDPLADPAPDLADFAAAAWEAMDSLGIGVADLYGSHFGTRLATELAIQRPERVRRLILDGEGLPDLDLLDELLEHVAPDFEPDESALYLLRAWHYVRDYYLFFPWYRHGTENRRPTGLPSARTLDEKLLELLRNGRTYGLSYRAGLRYPLKDRLGAITRPALVATAVTDNALPFLDELAAAVPGSIKLLTPGILTPEAAAETARHFIAFLQQ